MVHAQHLSPEIARISSFTAGENASDFMDAGNDASEHCSGSETVEDDPEVRDAGDLGDGIKTLGSAMVDGEWDMVWSPGDHLQSDVSN